MVLVSKNIGGASPELCGGHWGFTWNLTVVTWGQFSWIHRSYIFHQGSRREGWVLNLWSEVCDATYCYPRSFSWLTWSFKSSRGDHAFFEGCWLLLVAIPVKSVDELYFFRLFDGQQCQPGDGQLLPPPVDSGCFSLLHPAKESNVKKITWDFLIPCYSYSLFT